MLKVKMLLTIYFDKENLEYMCDRLGEASAVVTRFTKDAFKASLIADHVITSSGYYEIYYTDIEKGQAKVILDPEYVQEISFSGKAVYC